MGNAERAARYRHPAGRGIPESDEVREHREACEDAEAVDLANSGRDTAELDRMQRAIRDGLAYAGLVAMFLLLVFITAAISPDMQP